MNVIYSSSSSSSSSSSTSSDGSMQCTPEDVKNCLGKLFVSLFPVSLKWLVLLLFVTS